jgi:hypothetical protein
MITTDLSERVFQLLKFPGRPTPGKTGSALQPVLSLDDTQVQHVLGRLHVLARDKPAVAQWLLNFTEAFLTRHGVPDTKGRAS